MKALRSKKLIPMLLIGALAAMTPGVASALTPACTPINNTAALTYSVNSIPQTGINSTTATFVVANKVDLTVTRNDASYVSVTPGSSNQALSFTVTNTGNANQKYVLTFTEPVGGADPFTGADNFNATTPGVGAVSVTTVTTGTIAPGGTYSATIVSDISAARASGDIAVYGLVAAAYKVDGTTVEAADNSSVNSSYGTCTTDVVLADAAGSAPGSEPADLAKDGRASARGAYKVVSANLTFGKTATTIWDPVNFNTAPKAIPGALVRYVVTVSNAGPSNATLTQITDTLTGTLAMDPDLKVAAGSGPLTALSNESAAGSGFKITSGGTSTRATATTPAYFTTTSSADGVDLAGAVITATMGTVMPVEGTYAAGQLKSGESVSLTFNVVIQ